MKISDYEVIIVGSGAAGLFTAYKISERSDFKGKIAIITKYPFGESNSRYAQGGIAAVIKSNLADSVSLHTQDTLKSGAGLSDINTVQYISENSEQIISELVSLKAGFDTAENGDFAFTLGGGHSVKRVLHSGEDATGFALINALCEAVKNRENIVTLQRISAVELMISKEKECKGVVVFNAKTKEHEIILSDNIVLATGGCGQVYKYTTNPYGATGDGIALAYRAGADIQDMEFIQFHPTALALGADIKNRYLITEAMRGEGAKLVNNKGEEFMSQYSDNKELAQRDIVSRAILNEMKKEEKPNVFLDTRGISPEILLKRFPSITRKCLQSGIDISKDFIPVAPAAHYMIGGIKTNLNGETSIKGLYAAGEVTSTGFHGANRLASNSLLECVVCAGKLADDINIKTGRKLENLIEKYIKKYEIQPEIAPDIHPYTIELKNRLKDIMWNNTGIIRDEKSLTEALEEIEKIKNEMDKYNVFSSISEYELKNMIIVSELITRCALERKESRGAHFRSDYPDTQLKAEHSLINKEKI